MGPKLLDMSTDQVVVPSPLKTDRSFQLSNRNKETQNASYMDNSIGVLPDINAQNNTNNHQI